MVYLFLRWSILKGMSEVGPKKYKKLRKALSEIGKLLIDIAKLAFAGLVVGSVIRWDIPDLSMFTAGILLTSLSAFFWYIISNPIYGELKWNFNLFI